MKRVGYRLGDVVALGHDQRSREKAEDEKEVERLCEVAHELFPIFPDPVFDVVRGTAEGVAVRVPASVMHGERDLRHLEHHSDECDHPHPEEVADRKSVV